MNEPFAMTVSQLNEYMKTLIDSSPVLSNVCIVGEISNFTNHYKTGHLYFTLKDENSLVKAVMFRTYTGKLRFVPKDNMKVLVYGRISVFARDGVYQLYCTGLMADGIGVMPRTWNSSVWVTFILNLRSSKRSCRLSGCLTKNTKSPFRDSQNESVS